MLPVYSGLPAEEGDYVIVGNVPYGYSMDFYVAKVHNNKAYAAHTFYTGNKGRKWLRKVANIVTVIPSDNVYEEEKRLIEMNIAAANVYDISDYSEVLKLEAIILARRENLRYH